jgi:hypothetical protein
VVLLALFSARDAENKSMRNRNFGRNLVSGGAIGNQPVSNWFSENLTLPAKLVAKQQTVEQEPGTER